METRQKFFLRGEQVKRNALDFVQGLPTDAEKPLVVEIKPLTRSLEQNAKLHALLQDIANQLDFQGKKRSLEQWKMILISAHSIATGKPQEMAIGLEGEVINLRESSAQMGVKRMASLIEYVTAWAVGQGVRFNDYVDYWGMR